MNADEFNAFFRRFAREAQVTGVPDIIGVNTLISKVHHRSGQHPRQHYVRGRGGTSSFDDIFVETLMVHSVLEDLRPGDESNPAVVEKLVSFRTDGMEPHPLRTEIMERIHHPERIVPYCDALRDFTKVTDLGAAMRTHLQKSFSMGRSKGITPRLRKEDMVMVEELATTSGLFSTDMSPYAYSEGTDETRLFAIMGPTLDKSWYCYGREEDYLLTNLQSFHNQELREIRVAEGSIALISMYPWEPDIIAKARHISDRGIPIAEPKGKLLLGDREFAVFDWVMGMTLHGLGDIGAWMEFGRIIRRCHENGIVHMDIAGRNAIWEAHGSMRVKLIDLEHIEIVDNPSRGFGKIAREIAFESLSRRRLHDADIDRKACIEAFMTGYDRLPTSG